MWSHGQALRTIDPAVVGRGINNRVRVVQKPVNVNPWLNVNSSITFSYLIKDNFQLWSLVQFEITTAQNWRANNINRTPHRKVSKLKSKFSLTLGFLNWASYNPALIPKTLSIIKTSDFHTGVAKSSRMKFCYEFFTQISEHFREYFRLHWVDHCDQGTNGNIFFFCSLLAQMISNLAKVMTSEEEENPMFVSAGYGQHGSQWVK